jgi:hypothetical protein
MNMAIARTLQALGLSLLITGGSGATAAATFFGPTPYLSFADSPFKNLNLAQFYLETFEDGLLNTPGVSITSNQPLGNPLGVIGPSGFTDSVDADDGVIDGSGRGGHSFSSPSNQAYGIFGLTVTFSAAALNGLPTYAGLVWTDGSDIGPTLFEAFDAAGNSLGTVGPVRIGDSSFAGTTAEDRFFGVFNAAGISRITIRDPGSNVSLEIDHFQYGLDIAAVPESSTIALWCIGLLLLAARAKCSLKS